MTKHNIDVTDLDLLDIFNFEDENLNGNASSGQSPLTTNDDHVQQTEITEYSNFPSYETNNPSRKYTEPMNISSPVNSRSRKAYHPYSAPVIHNNLTSYQHQPTTVSTQNFQYFPMDIPSSYKERVYSYSMGNNLQADFRAHNGHNLDINNFQPNVSTIPNSHAQSLNFNQQQQQQQQHSFQQLTPYLEQQHLQPQQQQQNQHISVLTKLEMAELMAYLQQQQQQLQQFQHEQQLQVLMAKQQQHQTTNQHLENALQQHQLLMPTEQPTFLQQQQQQQQHKQLDYIDRLLQELFQNDYTDAMIQQTLKELNNLQGNCSYETLKAILNYRNEHGMVPILTAVRDKRNIPIIKVLLILGADVTVVNNDGDNLFHYVIDYVSREEEIVEILNAIFMFNSESELKKNFENLLNGDLALNAEGLSAVHKATMKKYPNVLKLLHKYKADLNITDLKEQQTAIVIASKDRSWEIVKLLIGLGACVNIQTSSNWRPVHASIADNDFEMLKYFMLKGVDIFDFWKFTKNKEMMDMIKKYMTKRRRQHCKGGYYDTSQKRRRRCNCGSEATIFR